MTADEFRDCLMTMRWSQRDLGDILDCNDRTVRRWAAGTQEIPAAVASWLATVAWFMKANRPPMAKVGE